MFFMKLSLKYYKQEHLKARGKVINDQLPCFKFIQFRNESFLDLIIFTFTWNTNTLPKKAHPQIIIKINFICKREIYSGFCSIFFSII